jgi:hypothetical protein
MGAYLEIETQRMYPEWDRFRYIKVKIFIPEWSTLLLLRTILLSQCHVFDSK